MPRKQRNSKDDVVTIKVKLNYRTAAASTAVLMNVLDASTASTGLSARSEVLAAYMDMYRYFRIDRLAFWCDTTTPQILYLNYLSPGTAAPTDAASFETTHQVRTSVYAPVPLRLGRSVFKNIGDWCVTQADATDEIFTSYGDLYVTSLTANVGTVLCQLELTVTFRQLLDPALISFNLGKHLSQYEPSSKPCNPSCSDEHPKRTFPPHLEVFKSSRT